MADWDDHRRDRAAGLVYEWTTRDGEAPDMAGVQRSSTAVRMEA